MPYKYCQHVKENGTFCSSGALRGRKYCYYHLRTRARQLAMAKAAAERKSWRIHMPPLENMQAVQVAVQQVIEALAADAIDGHRAGLMLYGLQQAASNVRTFGPSQQYGGFYVNPEDEGRAINYPGMEEEFGLPQRINLDASPDELFPPPAMPLEITPQQALLALGKVLDLTVLDELAAELDAAPDANAEALVDGGYVPLAPPLSPVYRLGGNDEPSNGSTASASTASRNRSVRLIAKD